MSSARWSQSAGVTFDESMTGVSDCTSMRTCSERMAGNSSWMPRKSNGTRAPVAGSVFMPIVPPV